jgi:hypothetical protein
MLLGELRESSEIQDKVFEMAVKKVPSMAHKIFDIFDKIDERLIERRMQLSTQ